MDYIFFCFVYFFFTFSFFSCFPLILCRFRRLAYTSMRLFSSILNSEWIHMEYIARYMYENIWCYSSFSCLLILHIESCRKWFWSIILNRITYERKQATWLLFVIRWLVVFHRVRWFCSNWSSANESSPNVLTASVRKVFFSVSSKMTNKKKQKNDISWSIAVHTSISFYWLNDDVPSSIVRCRIQLQHGW
jgi:hypothetical protein